MITRRMLLLWTWTVLLVGALSGPLLDGCAPREAQAQSTASSLSERSLSERQVIALERIASEMGRMRRECR